ncbi:MULTISPECIES: hypothetical protein [Bacillaceae]|uniref:Uncharacterized protein n=1 Tax=Gottfriedia luciferensis TaxID=178774 RepID=A0ABX2ZQS8_9BACI|nr:MULTISPECIES: hypothetical protein [Bacillaceae]ODG91060.1 hypothetical protein BED47_08510 [Gottfriedia luciferensis]PGZ87911.1 hypothetical protein COE53_20585 [Bacillus sp. AFS029533]SFC81629.1 hypothetical protein SAMN02799633_01799 [Bacillus sp. UNCCL81]
MKKILVVIAILITGIVGIIGYVHFQSGFDIKIKNQTNKDVTGIYLTYDHVKTDLKIPTIASHKDYKLNINPSKDVGESTMELHYKDNKGKLHTESVIGYFEGGYSGNILITIKSVDEDGKLKFKVKEDISLY